jgi:hypothetical protein
MTSGEALESDRLVKLSTSTLVYADAGDEPIGLTTEAVAISTPVACECLDGAIHKVTGSKAIAAGAAIYVAADGKVSDAAIGKQIGILGPTAISANGGKAAAFMWGPRGGNDVLTPSNNQIKIFDDFFEYDVTNDWAVVEDAGAAVGDVLTDAAGGVLSIGPDGDDNDECYVSSIAEVAKVQTTKKIFFEARVKVVEANTDDQNCIIGLSDTVAANSLLDNGAGPMASYCGIVFFKVDGGTVWQFEVSNAGTQVTTANAGAVTSGSWVTLGFLVDYNDGTTAKVTPFVDGVAGTVLDLTIAAMGEMHVLAGVKAGGTGTEEVLLVDYIDVQQDR